jgi:hypothetical protein
MSDGPRWSVSWNHASPRMSRNKFWLKEFSPEKKKEEGKSWKYKKLSKQTASGAWKSARHREKVRTEVECWFSLRKLHQKRQVKSKTEIKNENKSEKCLSKLIEKYSKYCVCQVCVSETLIEFSGVKWIVRSSRAKSAEKEEAKSRFVVLVSESLGGNSQHSRHFNIHRWFTNSSVAIHAASLSPQLQESLENKTNWKTKMDFSQLPDDVREKLAELELELSEGEKKVNWMNKQFQRFC